jgi:hypothetical protein
VFVTDTVVSNSAGGIAAKNAAAGNVLVSVQRTTLTQNTGFGLKADGSGAGAIIANVSDSLITGNGTGVLAAGGPSTSGIQVSRSSIVNNTIGAQATGAPGFFFSSSNLITGNGTGVASTGGGNLLTYKTNSVDGNFTNGAFTGTLIPE